MKLDVAVPWLVVWSQDKRRNSYLGWICQNLPRFGFYQVNLTLHINALIILSLISGWLLKKFVSIESIASSFKAFTCWPKHLRRLHQWPKHLVSFMNTFRRPVLIEGCAHAQDHFLQQRQRQHIHRQSPPVLNALLASSISSPACILFPFINSPS